MGDDNPPCKLLVRTLKHLMPNKMFGMEFNFHLIDLKNKKIELNYIPAIPMMNGGSIGNMTMLESESDSCIYILGAVLNPTVLNQSKKKYEEEDEEEDMIHFHCESSKYSLVSKRWDAFDVPVQTHWCSIPATIFGKLYFFGSPWCPPKVFENGWKDLELPTHLVHRKVAFPVIPDRINNRYLVHFFDSGEIYAFHPNSPSSDTTKAASASASAAGEWTCVVDNFNEEWSSPMAVSGNILFFHVFMLPALITAYDMSTNKWLEIVDDFTRVDKTVSHFDDLFTLPGNHDVLCLASKLPITCNNPSSVRILRLRFNHTIGSNQLTLTALDYQSYDIPIPSKADELLLL